MTMQKLKYYLVCGVLYPCSLLPLWVLYLLSDFIFVIIYRVMGYRIKIVRKNLLSSFPDNTEQELRRIERDFYHWFCDYLVEAIKLLTISKKQLRRRMVFKGTELVDQVVQEGQSCAVYLGHYCNLEWITSLPLWVTEKAQCGQIYHPLENSEFDRLFKNLRQRFGAQSVPMAETLRFLVKSKRENRPVVIGYISDQIPFWNNIHHWKMFLSQDTPVLTGTERLARQTGHAVFYMDVRRPKRGYYEAEFRLITREPQKMQEFELTDIYFDMLEETIRRTPQFWLWTHNRWKRTHEEFNLRYDEATGRVDITSFIEDIKRRKGLEP